ncbi:hypothetical protein [Oryza sativa Japonica Group]|uniref:Uncharacterized protein P0710A02.23 n=1 Tax=Oryza sativa subsp. japonica TaxID=39947 RepID=Q5ZD41_ORYSJ|nr:hypothetical protein [Oryza sativa Japonica Group]
MTVGRTCWSLQPFLLPHLSPFSPNPLCSACSRCRRRRSGRARVDAGRPIGVGGEHDGRSEMAASSTTCRTGRIRRGMAMTMAGDDDLGDDGTTTSVGDDVDDS